VTLPALAHRPSVVSAIAAVGLGLTFGAMIVFDAFTTLGAVAFAPWVGLIGFDTGMLGGLVAATGATGLWLAAAETQNVTTSSGQLLVRLAAFAVLGIGAGLVGSRLRESE
jgi:hypothetical protein